MAAPQKVGRGELGRIARKKGPAAPRCCSVVSSVGWLRALWTGASRLSMPALYQFPWNALQSLTDPLHDPGLEFLAVGPTHEHFVGLDSKLNARARPQLARDVPVC